MPSGFWHVPQLSHATFVEYIGHSLVEIILTEITRNNFNNFLNDSTCLYAVYKL